MAELTKYEALIGELDPYTPSPLTLKKALMDANAGDPEDEYGAADKPAIALAAIHVLKKLIVLASDSMGKSSQSYSVEALKSRIKDLCNENGFDDSDFVEVPTITDGSNLW